MKTSPQIVEKVRCIGKHWCFSSTEPISRLQAQKLLEQYTQTSFKPNRCSKKYCLLPSSGCGWGLWAQQCMEMLHFTWQLLGCLGTSDLHCWGSTHRVNPNSHIQEWHWVLLLCSTAMSACQDPALCAQTTESAINVTLKTLCSLNFWALLGGLRGGWREIKTLM